MKRKNKILFVFCFLSATLFAQNRVITGVVTEAGTDEALSYVLVHVKGTDRSTPTNLDGFYSIEAEKGDVLVFSLLSMETVNVTVGESNEINVTMREGALALEQVVVIGYGTTKKSHLSGAVGSVSSSDLQTAISTNVANALQGKMAGVSVTSASGKPGGSLSVNVRGVGSLTNSSPLYVIDGSFGDISMVDPADIASIEVLKDASAAAIYGSRAANGVVLISTKGGRKESACKLNLTVFTGIQRVANRIRVFNANEYSRFAKLYNLPADGYGNEHDATVYEGAGTNWHDAVFRNALTSKINLNISGGSKTAIYSVSLGYLNQDGIMKSSGYESYNTRIKSDYFFLNDKLQLGQTLILKSSVETGHRFADHLFSVLQMPPTIPVYDESRVGGFGATNNLTIANPLGALMVNEQQSRSTNIFFNAYAQYEIIKGLKYKVNLGVNQGHPNRRKYTKAFDFGAEGTNEMPDLNESKSTSGSKLLENTLSYDITRGAHSLQAMLGYSMQTNQQHSIWAQKIDLNPLITTLSPPVADDKSNNGGSFSESRLLSQFGRAMYSYKDRYLFSASVRRDASSRFRAGYRAGFFPSGSFGWNIHEESFAEPMKKFVDQLKLRLSYGKLGNQEINSNYATHSFVTSGMNYVQGNSIWLGLIPDVYWTSPMNLTWENTETYNLGIDASFFNGKLSFTGDFFVKNTNDVLLAVNMPEDSGMGGRPTVNAGVIANKGLELSLQHANRVGEFNYNLSFNLSTLKNEVKEIKVGNPDMMLKGYDAHGEGGQGITMFQRGHSVSFFNLIETDGIFKNSEEIAAHAHPETGEPIQPGAKVGDMRYKDYNGDGKIDENDQHDVGNPFPDVAFGLRFGADWKNFDLNMFFDATVGNMIYNYPRHRIESGKFRGNYGVAVAKAWRPNYRETDIPRFSMIDGASNQWAYTDRWLENGSFLRLKTIELGYSLEKSILDKIGLSNFRIYLSCENLFTLTKYKGMTPDLGESVDTDMGTGLSYRILSKGVDQGRYPLARMLSVGVQIGL